MLSASATAAGGIIGIAGIIGVVDVIIKTFLHAKNVCQASKMVAESIGQIVDICENVNKLLKKHENFPFPQSVIDGMNQTLEVVRKIADKYENHTLGRRIRQMPKALGRLNELDKVEHRMQTVFTLIAANISGETWANTKRTVEILAEQQDALAQVHASVSTTSARIEAAMSHAEKRCGPLSGHALDDKVEEFFQGLGESMRSIENNMETMLPTMESIRNDTRDIISRLPAPVETTLQDSWVCDYSSVPAAPSYAVETHYVRNLKQEFLGKALLCRVVTVHGMGGVGKTTACKMIANDENVRQQFKHGIVWVELGETASCSALIERLAQAVKRSGGEKAADSFIRLTDAGKFKLAKVEFHHWFNGREVLFVLDNIWDSKDHGFNQWIDVIREIPGGKSFLLCSSRTRLGQKNVEFSELNDEEQTQLFLEHLQLQQDSGEYQEHMEVAEQIIHDCKGLPLALAMAAGYLKRDPRGWKSLSDNIRKEIATDDQPMFRIPLHPGLYAVFQTSLEWLGRENAPPQNCPFGWPELYTSLCVTDPASPGLPLCVLSLMWGMNVESAQSVCQEFVRLSLATLSFAENTDKRMVNVHDLQLAYCRGQCGRARAPSDMSARSLVPECTWHREIIDGLLAQREVPVGTDESMDVGSLRASCGLQGGAATANDVLKAFMELAGDSALDEYFLKNLVRHICGYEGEGLVELVRGVLGDYRWLLAVSMRLSLSFAASQYSAVVSRVRKWEESHDGSKWSDDATAFGRGFIGDVQHIAHILRVCVPPAAVDWTYNGEEAPCPVHGERSVGNPGLAHQLLGRLGHVGGDESSLVLEAGGSEGRSLVDLLVQSIKRWARAPRLLPVNRCYFEADREALAHVMREDARRCLTFFHGNAEHVAFAGWNESACIRVYNLESGDLHCELYKEGTDWIDSIATASDGCGATGNDVGDAVDGVWLAAGYTDGIVRIWVVETARCVATLHPMYTMHETIGGGISVAPDRRRVVHFIAPHPDNPEKGGGLNVWDLSSDGTQESYAFVHGCKNQLGFELASAALLYDESKHCNVEHCSSCAVRFEQSSSLQSKMRTKHWSYFSRRFRQGLLGCVASREVSERLEASVSTLHMTVVGDLVAELADSDDMVCCRVANCNDDRVLVVAVLKTRGRVTVVDALTSEVIDELQAERLVESVAAFRRADGRILVVTGDFFGMVRMRVADSGYLIGQWQTSSNFVVDVAIAIKTGMLMGAYDEGGLWIWSIGEDRTAAVAPSNKSTAVADGLLPSQQWPPNQHQQRHSKYVSSIAFSGDGKLAASCSCVDKFVLVWDTTTGTVLRQLDIAMVAAEEIRAWGVAISSSGDWILCAGGMGGNDSDDAFVHLWGPSNQQHKYFGEFKRQSNKWAYQWGATILPCSSEDRICGSIFIKPMENGCETYEWGLSRSSEPEIVVTTTTTATEKVAAEMKLARQGSRMLLFEDPFEEGFKKVFHVRKAGPTAVDCCTCKAPAVFDSLVQCESAWSDETNAQPDDRANTSPKVAVGLSDGTVHFMEIREEREGG